WRFALSSARAALWPHPTGRWPVLTLVTGVAAATTAVAGSAAGAAGPGVGGFAAGFTRLVGAMVILAVARPRRLWPPVPVPAVLVTGGVAASITMTVIFLLREPSAAEHLPPAAAVFLAAALAGCLRIATASPRQPSTDRLAPHL